MVYLSSRCYSRCQVIGWNLQIWNNHDFLMSHVETHSLELDMTGHPMGRIPILGNLIRIWTMNCRKFSILEYSQVFYNTK